MPDGFSFRKLVRDNQHPPTREELLEFTFYSDGEYVVYEVDTGKYRYRNSWKLVDGVVYYKDLMSGVEWKDWLDATLAYEAALSNLITE